MIKPTVGRVVWYRPAPSDNIPAAGGQPLAAIVAFVHSESCVNLSIIDADGNQHSRTSVYLKQEATEQHFTPYAEWMPYQIGQAARTEAAEAKAGA